MKETIKTPIVVLVTVITVQKNIFHYKCVCIINL